MEFLTKLQTLNLEMIETIEILTEIESKFKNIKGKAAAAIYFKLKLVLKNNSDYINVISLSGIINKESEKAERIIKNFDLKKMMVFKFVPLVTGDRKEF